MPQFIVDANLPFRVNCWNSEAFVHVVKINAGWDDEHIWAFAKEKNLTIITKDKDFSVRTDP